MTEEQAKQLASDFFNIPKDRFESRPLDNDAGFYVYQPIRGAGALMIAHDNTVLFANSSVVFDTHLAAFMAGKRTDPSKFIQQ